MTFRWKSPWIPHPWFRFAMAAFVAKTVNQPIVCLTLHPRRDLLESFFFLLSLNWWIALASGSWLLSWEIIIFYWDRYSTLVVLYHRQCISGAVCNLINVPHQAWSFPNTSLICKHNQIMLSPRGHNCMAHPSLSFIQPLCIHIYKNILILHSAQAKKGIFQSWVMLSG